MKRFIPEFDHYFLSVHQTSDEIIKALSDNTLLGTLMLTYKKVDDHDFAKNHAEEFFKFLKTVPEKQELLLTFVIYFLYNANLSGDEINEFIKKLRLPSQLKSDTMTAYESIREEYLKEGEARGEARGIKEGIKEGEVLKSKTAITRLLLRGI